MAWNEMVINLLSKWEEVDGNIYRDCYFNFGGNVSTHPDVLQFQHGVLNAKERYFAKMDKEGKPIASICVWNNQFIANDQASWSIFNACPLPVSKDELILPLKKDCKIILPFKAKTISEKNALQIRNSTFSFNARRRICIAKNISEFSQKTKQTREREMRKFMSSGGVVRPVSDFTLDDIMELYNELYYKRRGEKIGNFECQKAFIKHMNNIFGFVLFIYDRPCAFQLITKAESAHLISYDYINIGVDPAHDKLCPGTVLTWLNLKEADKECAAKNKEMRFSFGKPTMSYKDRYCYHAPVGRTVVF